MGLSAVGVLVTFTLIILAAPLATEAQQPGKLSRIGHRGHRARPGAGLRPLAGALSEAAPCGTGLSACVGR
jgi:hypothetical protein